MTLFQGRFRLKRSERERAHEHFVNCYILCGQPWIARRVHGWADRIGVKLGSVRVHDLGYRWGSAGRSNSLNFHWRAIQLPPRILECLVAHEMVHLIEPHHSEAFWARLERAMPDTAAHKQWLAQNGSRF